MGSFSLEEWLEQIDPTMKDYASNLEKFGFGSLKTLRNIDSDDINNYLPEMLPGHKKALLEETKKLITPVKCNERDSLVVLDAKRQKQLDFGNKASISTNAQNNSTSGNISVVVNATEREVEKSDVVSLSKKLRIENSDDNPSVPRTITNKEEELVTKLSEVEVQIETKTEEIKCFMIPVESLPPLGNMASVCGNCHRKGHRAEGNKGKKDCGLDKCKSFFICGQKSRHPEYSKQLAQKKKELSNLQETLKNVTDELNMLRNFVEKTSETNFMLDVKRRLRITDPQKYRDVAVLLRDTRTLKVAYKGKIPPSDQNDSEEFARLLKQTKHKIKRDTGDFNFSDSDDSESADFEDIGFSIKTNSVSRKQSTNIVCTQKEENKAVTCKNIDQFLQPTSASQCNLSQNTMPAPFPLPFATNQSNQCYNQWSPHPQPVCYPHPVFPFSGNAVPFT